MKPSGWLLPLSLFYQAGVQIRNRLYDNGILESQTVETPVISVGNISVGGTGKTPHVIFLVERLKSLMGQRKIKTAVITRGYKGAARGTHVVSDGRKVISTPYFAGDEPVLIAESLPGTVVIKDKNRTRGARYAIDEAKSGILVLDDGFQHRRLNRDLDIVLLDAENPLGNRRTLPAGFLREPVSALSRADIVVLSKAVGTEAQLAERAERLAELISKPVVVTSMVPKCWRLCHKAELHWVEEVKGKRVLAFAGIAKPKSFFDMVESIGAEIAATLPLPDHCNYQKKYLDLIGSHFVTSRAEWIVTTGKDAVKLPGILSLLPIYYLDIGIEVMSGADILDSRLKEVISKSRSRKMKDVLGK